MSTTNATIISPLITKQIIKQEIIKEEDECIRYISTSTSSRNNSNSNSTTTSLNNEESLDVRNGHNYTAAIIKSTSNNQNTSHQHHQQQQQTISTLHRGVTTITTTANNNHRSSSANIKRIEFPISKHQINNSNSNSTTQTSINVDLFSAPASLEHSPSSSPLNYNNNNDTHHQEMFCSSTVSGDINTNVCLDTNDLNKVRDSSPKRLCLVCGDTASGFHYGVASCEACKAFFKRTIQGNIEYTCPATNNCEINKRRRKACQACRFQKCLRMGMLKEGVRLDRVRGGRQKYRRTSEAPYQGQNYSLKKSNIDDNRIIAALIKCEPEPIMSNANIHLYSPSSNNSISSVSSSQYKNLCILSELVDKELVATIAWAKQIPGFTDLILNDQMRLLQSTWAEILSLSLAFRSQQYSSPPNTPACLSPSNASSTTNPIFNKLVFATDFIIDDQQAAQCNAEELFAHLIQLIRRLNQLKIAKEEYLLMKAIILTNADIQLENQESVSKLRDTLLQTLQECVSILRPQSAINHLSQIFLCFPLLRQLDTVTRRLWSNILQEGSVPMQKLFVEMLESNVAF
ncbi:steroid hormone receptor ERR2 [Dermatophagoides farinae]|uniref:steroid hormone receptor ERR2 n=1 Tax=Dermatophagoides farinae TaxID=6954 RepID=UPI003F604101